MGLITIYGAYHGTPSELREPNDTEKWARINPSDYKKGTVVDQVIKLVRPQSGLIVPRFVGIYEGSGSDDSDTEISDMINNMREVENHRIANMLGGIITQNKGVARQDSLPWNLIYLLYDKMTWPSQADVRECLDDDIRRVRISPIENIPNFYERDPKLALGSLVQIGDWVGEGVDTEEINKRIVPDVKKLGKQIKKYGGTRLEYDTYRLLKQAIETEKGDSILSKIYKASPSLN
jgi:hypothetical protein